ncbi:MAG: hypothetical protein KTM48_02040, partial [Wolbachia endosymbiont of Pissodes strobi]|nr:hypothetical protein [Wolbachia endosymbiont of Pissodes strobi]
MLSATFCTTVSRPCHLELSYLGAPFKCFQVRIAKGLYLGGMILPRGCVRRRLIWRKVCKKLHFSFLWLFVDTYKQVICTYLYTVYLLIFNHSYHHSYI